MTRRARLSLLATAVALGALGVAGLVAAQQGEPAAGVVAPVKPAVAPPPAGAEAPPPAANALPAAIPAPTSSDAADVQPDDAAPSAAAAAALKPAQPMTRPRFGVAVIQAMDKVTAETIRFEAPVGKPVRYKSLIFIVRACETTAPDEAISDAATFVEIDSVPMAQEGAVAAPARQVFRGWMFANAPGLHLFQNPAYDAWAIACKTASPAA
jgi:hypothetical protein